VRVDWTTDIFFKQTEPVSPKGQNNICDRADAHTPSISNYRSLSFQFPTSVLMFRAVRPSVHVCNERTNDHTNRACTPACPAPPQSITAALSRPVSRLIRFPKRKRSACSEDHATRTSSSPRPCTPPVRCRHLRPAVGRRLWSLQSPLHAVCHSSAPSVTSRGLQTARRERSTQEEAQLGLLPLARGAFLGHLHGRAWIFLLV